MAVEFTLTQNVAFRRAYNPGTVPNAATFGDFIDVRGFNHATFIPQVGDFGTGSIIIEVYENSAANSSGATAVGSSISRFLDGTSEDKLGLIEVNLDKIVATNRYLGLRITPPAAIGFFAATAALSLTRNAPPLNGTAQNVAFVTRV